MFRKVNLEFYEDEEIMSSAIQSEAKSWGVLWNPKYNMMIIRLPR